MESRGWLCSPGHGVLWCPFLTPAPARSCAGSLINARERRKDGNPHTHLTDTSGGAPGDPARQATGRTAAGGRELLTTDTPAGHGARRWPAGAIRQEAPEAPAFLCPLPHRCMETPPGESRASQRAQPPRQPGTGGPEHHPQGPLFQAKHARCRKPAKPPWPKAAQPHCRSVPVLPLSYPHNIPSSS